MLAALEHARDAERRFLADASHELRTPVTALRGNVDYLQRHGYDEAVLAEVAADTARLSALVRDLLVLSREDAGGTTDQYVRLEALVEEVVQDDPQITVDAPRPVAVRGDRPALERALRNLVDNARRYGPPGGRITVSAHQDNGSALLSVSDEGRGLSGEEAERAFERFWRGRHDAPGSGLGLAIVRATAERHGGRVGVRGPEFTIELPALREFSNGSGTPRTERRKGHQ
jgi:signal transduction histidine kinase